MTGRAPSVAYLLPTGRCNLHCGGCYATLNDVGRKTRKGELSIDEYRQAIAELLALGVRTFDISGGEPLLYPDLVAICEAIRAEPDARIWLVTNGTVRQDKLASLSRLVHKIVFSLDAPTPELHDELRGLKGAFAKTLASVRMARKLPFDEVAINFTVSRLNVETIDAMLALAASEQVDRLALLTFRDVSENGVMFDQLPDLESLRRSWSAVARCLAGSASPRAIDLVVPAFLFPESSAFRRTLPAADRPRLFLHHPHLRGLSAYRETIVVKPFGTLSGDTAMVNTSLFDVGSVRDGIAEVWATKAPQWRERLAERERHLQADGPCGSCSRWHYCRGGCPAAATHQWGDLMRHDRSCDAYRQNGDF